jgi:hypothetical protein
MIFSFMERWIKNKAKEGYVDYLEAKRKLDEKESWNKELKKHGRRRIPQTDEHKKSGSAIAM